MPIEIKELFITANVYDGRKKEGDVTTSAVTQQGPVIDEETKLHIIEQAVQQVLYILERQKDR